MSDTVLSFAGVSRWYHMGDSCIKALDKLDLSFSSGEFVAIAGPSGSGKSTLLHLGAGLDRPDEGQVTVMNVCLSKSGETERALLRNKSIGFVFQDFNLLPALSAEANVAWPALLHPGKRTRREILARARLLLDESGIVDQAKKKPHQMSGGQRQRVAIARALMNEPALIFADEPTANLDRACGPEILDLLERLNREHGASLILSTHDETVMKRARRIVRLLDGRLSQ